MAKPNLNAYERIIEQVFFNRFKKGMMSVEFERADLVAAARAVGIKDPKNLGDVVYSFRYRKPLPDAILKTCPSGREWIIRGLGPAKYRFVLVPETRIEPRAGLYQIKVPDATPEIVARYALSDEQALLARVRYNRLVDIFTGVACYSLQNHLRTTVPGIGQVETDELYVGVSKSGAQFIIPVQAKGGSDRLGRVQLEQDVALCRTDRFRHLIARPIAAQFMAGGVIAMFELRIEDDRLLIVDERHYKLVPAPDIRPEDLEFMGRDHAGPSPPTPRGRKPPGR